MPDRRAFLQAAAAGAPAMLAAPVLAAAPTPLTPPAVNLLAHSIVRDLPNVQIAVPDDPARHCTITSFRLKGMATEADAQRVQRTLFDKYRIHPVWRGGIANGPVIRVTPGPYSSHADLDALTRALRIEHTMFA